MPKRKKTRGVVAAQRRTSPRRAATASTKLPFPVIAVGASAGGLEAFTVFLRAFPAKSGMAVIFVQHLDPKHKSMMAGLLAPHTQMPVLEVKSRTRIGPNKLYVIAPGTYLGVRSGALVVSEPTERHGTRLPIDFLLRSMAESLGEHAIAVILSGNGADGSLGVKEIKHRGGLVVVQDPEEAVHHGMPQSAIQTGVVDMILPIKQMPKTIAGYIERLDFLPAKDTSALSHQIAAKLAQITEILLERTAQDFTAYKPGTLLRRIERRMAIRAIGDIDAYSALLRDDSKEVESLAKDFLIHVTSFFRDAEVFDLLAGKIIPKLVQEHPADQPLRVWVPACSSGEEVYSLAMLFLETMMKLKKNVKLQMFGSDIDEHAVLTARSGRYPVSIKTDVSPERLERFFIEDAGGYRVAQALREVAIFTVQDILTDPPFARIDLVSCRNLLIYLLPEIQQRILSLIHFALRKDGILLLGIAENIGALRANYEAVSADFRVFRHIGQVRKLASDIGFNDKRRTFWPRPATGASTQAASSEEISRQLLLESYAPPSVLINNKHEGIYYFGPTENYLQIPTGDASHGLFAMVKQGLRNKLRIALQRASSQKATVAVAGAMVKNNGASVPVTVEVRPVQKSDGEYFIVSFVDTSKNGRDSAKRTPESATSLSKTAELETLVEALQKELQDTAQELEIASANQEAINEEAQSLNEEFQSTNEELETSKEELQSLNEELTALNSQLTATVNQQRDTADDLENILRSSELAIVFLDRQLNIRFFSFSARALFNVIDSDLGRPIGHLAYDFDDESLDDDIKAVLKTQTAITRDIRSHAGDWYTRRVLPYRTRKGASQGVVLTFANISVMKAAEVKIQSEQAYSDSVINTVRQPLVVIDERLRIVSTNLSFCRTFGVEVNGIIGQDLTVVGNRCFDTPAMNSLLDRTQAESAPIEDYEIEVDLPPAGRRVVQLSSRKILGDLAAGRILLAFEDITERKLIAEKLEIAKSKAEKANLGKSRFLAAASHDLRQPLQSLSLLHGLLKRQTTDAESLTLIGKLDETLGAMAGMLDTLLDINQLEAGTVQPEIDNFPINTVLNHIKNEFTYLAKSKGLALHVIGSHLRVRSDPLLLAQMIRNLLSNAIKYTARGKILVGCRRKGANVRLEVWDTGIGIPKGQLKAIFEEYHQLGNPARERGLGLGLGLSIVHRVGELLGHEVTVRSEAGRGSVFIVGVPIESKQRDVRRKKNEKVDLGGPAVAANRTGEILIVEDDPAVREGMALLFTNEGHRAVTASDGIEVAALIQGGKLNPDVVVADYNLPGGKTGLTIIQDLRKALAREMPAIVLTGDISTDVLRKVVAADCGYLHKPVNVDQLTHRVADLISMAQEQIDRSPARKLAIKAAKSSARTIFIVDDDVVMLESLRDMLLQKGHAVEIYASAELFLSAYQAGQKGCLIVDSVMPGMSGLELLQRLKLEGHELPSIVITGYGDISMAIKAMQGGAVDFIEKPAREEVLLASINRALTQSGNTAHRSISQTDAARNIAALTRREREVMALVVEGRPNKEIATALNISQRTVESHRASVMKRTASASLPDLIRLVMRAA